MKYLIALILLAPSVAMAGVCKEVRRECNVATTVGFYLVDPDGIDFKEDAEHASGDTVIMQNEGTPANTSNAFVDEGDSYSIALTQAEMNASRITISIKDQGSKAWLDSCIEIETYGTTCGQHSTKLGALDEPALAQFGIVSDLVASSTDNTVTLDNAFPDGILEGASVIVTDSGDPSYVQVRRVTDNTGAVLTVATDWDTNPSADMTATVGVTPPHILAENGISADAVSQAAAEKIGAESSGGGGSCGPYRE